MSNPARKFKRTWIITAEGTSRGAKGEMTFFEKFMEDVLVAYVNGVGVYSQDVKVTMDSGNSSEID